MAAGFYTMREPMKRLLAVLPAALVTLLVLAPAALAHDGGEGWWGETNDKVVTNAGFILIVFFPLFILFASLLQGALDRRNVSVVLLDEQGDPVARWNLRRAWPAKWSGPSLDALGNEVAIESLELAHEGIELE
jgi:hypothetical protein